MMLGETKVQVTVISPKWQGTEKMFLRILIVVRLLLNVTTGYHQKINMRNGQSSLKRDDLLNDMILAIDPTAFIISNATHSVRGRGFTLPH